MKKVVLGNTDIYVSQLGFGTGTASRGGGSQQACLPNGKLVDLLLYAYDQGIDFWDTALAYKTHHSLGIAARKIGRNRVVIATKLHCSGYCRTRKLLEQSLRELQTDYVDICFMHGVRTRREFFARQGALAALIRAREEGLIRGIGLSSHGVAALEGVEESREIDVLLARINFQGVCMDSSRLGIYDRCVSIPLLRWFGERLYLGNILGRLTSASSEHKEISLNDFSRIHDILSRIHRQGRGVVGMKVLGQGQLSHLARRSFEYVKQLGYVDSFVVGMNSRNEIDVNCQLLCEI